MIEGPAYGIVVAAGRSERMGGIDKVYAELMGRPLLAWTLRAFKACAAIDGVVLVASHESLDRARALVREWRFEHVSAVVPGGDTRQASVRAGLDATDGAVIVAIQDGARPLVTPDLIERGVLLARTHRAAICATPARDTVKRAEGETIVETIDRGGVWLAQTPQAFDRALLLEAHLGATGDATDDAALVEASGSTVHVYDGGPWNIKVTTPEDLIVAEALLRARFAD